MSSSSNLFVLDGKNFPKQLTSYTEPLYLAKDT